MTITWPGTAVPAVSWSLADVAAPSGLRPDSCLSCTTAGPDGFADLVQHVDREALAAAVGDAADGACLLLDLRGNLAPAAGGGPIRGADVVRVQRR